MYHIDSLKDKPDIGYLYRCINESAKAGIRIGSVYTEEETLQLKNSLQQKLERFKEDYGINARSNKELEKWFRANMHPDYIICFKDRFKLGKTEVSRLAEKGHQIANDIQEIRSLCSLVYKGKEKGLVYPKISISATNRIYYKNPNIHQLPNESILPLNSNKEYTVCVDIHNQEPLIYAEVMGAKALHDLLAQPNTDFYTELSKAILGEGEGERGEGEGGEEEEPLVTVVERKAFKGLWIMLLYGATLNSLMDCGCGLEDEVVDRVYRYFNSIPEIKRYKNYAYIASKRIVPQETFFGTRLEEDGRRTTNRCINKPIQGTASDIMSIMLKHANNEFNKRGLSDKIHFYYYRFDEFCFRVSKEIPVDEAKVLLQDILEHQVDNWAPFKVEIKVYNT